MSGASKILIGSGAVDLPSDDEFDNVSFLSHFDGSNNGTNIAYDDSSASNHTISGSTSTGAYGNLWPTQGTFGPFARVDGEWSNYFDGDGDYLTPAVSSDFAFGTGDFTIEAWVYFAAGTGNNRQIFQLSNGYLNNQVRGPALMAHTTTNRWRWYYGTTAADHGSIGPDANTWYHFAFVRNSGTSKVYIDGTEILSVSDSTNYTDTYFVIGGNWGTDYLLNGYLSNFRIVKGTAVYTSNFTPSTSALTAISGTVLLTCQSNRFKDNSASAHALTFSSTSETTDGVPKVSAFTPFLTSKVYKPTVNGASAWFSGVEDAASHAPCLNLVASGDSDSDFYFGTGAFTLEGWFYPTGENAGSSSYVIGFGVMMTVYLYKNLSISWTCSLSNTAAASSAVIAATYANTNINPLFFQWNHWAITRSGSNMSIFLNGTRLGTVSDASGSFVAPDNNDSGATASNAKIHLGAYNDFGEGEWGGYQSDFRIVKGTAVYDPTSSTYTVPTAPLTAITNTKLLLNMADGQALDSAAQNNMTLTTGAVTSTTQQKFGTASLDLTASDVWVTFPTSTNYFGSGNFTIECWVYVEDASSYNSIISFGDPIQFYVKSNTLECYAKDLITSGGFVTNFKGPASSISDDTWCHVAMVRNGTLFTAYVNGVGGTAHDSGSTAAISTSYAASPSIGAYNSSPGGAQALSFDGYIDDFRISHFARYTSNFTPTTEAFPDKGQ